MKGQYFLYDYSLEQKQRFLEKVVGNLEDLIFVFELNTYNIIFHNNSINANSYWEEILQTSNFIDAIRSKLNPNDLPALQQLVEKIKTLRYRDFIVRDLHLRNKELLYCHYQIEMSLFDEDTADEILVMCKVHTEQDQLRGKDDIKNFKDFSKIILVDDDVLTNILNEKIIESLWPQVDIVILESVDEALKWLKEFDKNGDFLIFLDINFPGKNGWDFMKSYNDFELQSKVIMLSTSFIPDDRIKALTYDSVIQYMCKPLTFEVLESLFN